MNAQKQATELLKNGMWMERYPAHVETPHQRTLKRTVEALQQGELVIYPTDTVYGIGCSLYCKSAIDSLYKLKGKSKFEHMSILCSSIQQAAEYVRISNRTFRLLKKCFPGPYTIILEAKNNITKMMLSRQKEIGIRIPDTPLCQSLIEMLGHPILNTSVKSGESEDEHDVYASLSQPNPYTDAAAIFLDAGPLPGSGASTVLRIIRDEIEVLREGKGSLDILHR